MYNLEGIQEYLDIEAKVFLNCEKVELERDRENLIDDSLRS
jgi:hypothetical protein